MLLLLICGGFAKKQQSTAVLAVCKRVPLVSALAADI